VAVLPRMTGQERRQAIVDAAIQLFSERGFRGVTTREVAQAVGVTEPVLYQHFPSKRDLYRAIIEYKIAQTASLKERFEDLCLDPGPPEQFFFGLGKLIVAWHQSDPSFIRLFMFASLEGHELQQIFHENMMVEYFRVLVGTVARLMGTDEFRHIDPTQAAYTFCAMITTHCLDRLLFCHPCPEVTDDEMVATMVDIYLNGLKKKDLA
jgi:AcrR family transcriptional regulator